MKTEIITIGQVLLLLLLVPRCNILTNAVGRDRPYGHNKIPSHHMRESSFGPRISGGLIAAEGSFPSYVSLRGKNSTTLEEQLCGGVALSENMILTAGQCFYRKGFDMIQAAASIYHPDLWEENNVKTYLVEKSCRREDFQIPRSDPKYLANDYQILRLSSPIPSMNYSRLPEESIPLDVKVAAVGLGLINDQNDVESSPESLHVLDVRRVICRSPFKRNLCLTGTGFACEGDTGSPAYATTYLGEQVVVGIATTQPGECRKVERGVSLYTDTYKSSNGIMKLIRECESSQS